MEMSENLCHCVTCIGTTVIGVQIVGLFWDTASHVTATATHPSGDLWLHDTACQVDDDVSIGRNIHVVDGLDPSAVPFLEM
jgi:hypothetical protein